MNISRCLPTFRGLWEPLWGPMLGRTCWTRLNPPRCAKYFNGDLIYNADYNVSDMPHAGFTSEAEVEKFFTERKSLSAFGAIVFDVKSFVGHRIRSNSTVTYKIRLPSESETRASLAVWFTTYMMKHPNLFFTVPIPATDMYGGAYPGSNWCTNIIICPIAVA